MPLRAPIPGPANRPQHSETPGELCDRLLIIALKRANAERRAREADLAPTARERCKIGAARLRRWQAHLHRCLSELLADIDAGRAALAPRWEFKMYNDSELNPVIRAEST